MTNTKWKDIPGYEDRYMASVTGYIKRKEIIINMFNGGVTIHRELILSSAKDKGGYLRLQLRDGKVRKNYCVHRLVAITFIPNYKNKPQINHKNGIKTDNSIENLEWNTAKENIIHAFNKGLKINAKGKDNTRSITIIQLTMNGDIVKEWESGRIMQDELGYNQSWIAQCCRENKSSFGFFWKYKVNKIV